jgi:Zn-dependent M28 family amino/carboxypeptidase
MQKMLSSALASAFATSLALAIPAHSAPTPSTAPTVHEAPLRAHLQFLSSDALEGRGTGQRGGDLAVAYLESQAMAAGLKPGNGNSYRQSVKIAGIKASPQDSSVVLEAGGKPQTLTFGKDWVWAPGDAKATHAMDAEMVFVGYGITAQEQGWDDYKGIDCKGKVLVMMVNDPMPTASEPDRFGGKGLTYYGRWTYKFEEAARHGAAGVLLIHTDASASYGWSVVQNSWLAERFQLAGGKDGTAMQGWMTESTARGLFKAAGQDLDALRTAAESKSFKPVLLAAKVKGETRAEVRLIDQFNVAGIVPGTDPVLKDEVVIYSAHWDHLGKQGKDGETRDTIYNGAVDNATAKPEPDLAGGYFRSDHFSFAKAGIPAFSIEGGRDYIKDAVASTAKARTYGEQRYHQVSDEYDANWDLAGMVQQAQFTLNLGRMIANAPKMPAWKAGDAFGKVRAGGM